jgi:hypothetical protein
LQYRSIEVKAPRRVALHAAAVSELEFALRLARELQNKLWGEPIAQEWALAALEEAGRLRDNGSPNSPAGVAAAQHAIEALKPYSEPWYAYLSMLILPQERKADTVAYFDEMQRRSEMGLGPCRQQDRYIQFLILLKRSEERAFFARTPVGEDFNKALVDAQAALDKAKEIGRGDWDRAYAIGMMGLARTRLYLKASGDEREKLRDKARENLSSALALAPKHQAAWQWSALLGVIERVEREQKKFETAQQAAAYFAEPYRLFREVEPTSQPINFHESTLAGTVDVIRADIEKNAPDYLRQGLKAPNLPDSDRTKWQLALAEMLARSGNAEKSGEARSLLEAATRNMPAAEKKAHTLQIERIKDALAKSEKK